MKHSFLANADYRNFIHARDKALDEIYLKYQRVSNAITKWLIDESTKEILSQYIQGRLTYRTMENKDLHNKLINIFHRAARDYYISNQKCIRRCYILAHIGEAEAIGRARIKKTKYKIEPQKFDDKEYFRVRKMLNKLLRKLYNYIENGLFNAKNFDEFAEYVSDAFPKAKQVKRPKRKLKKFTESKNDFEDDEEELTADEISSMMYPKKLSDEFDMTTGIISDDEWRGVVDDYMKSEVDPLASIYGRSTKDVYDIQDIESKEYDEVYGWELEQSMSHEYVKSVREGGIDAANENGYTDLMWVAVVDAKTCDDCCDGSGCSDRDGLTSTEIEKKYGDPIMPPAHANCRCSFAPYDPSLEKYRKDIEDELDLPTYGDFEKWLNS
jgi:hypothetical protein